MCITEGFEHLTRFDFEEIIASSTQPVSQKTLSNIPTKHDLNVIQLGIRIAYLNGKPRDQISIEPTEGIKENSEMVAESKRALYGLLY